MSDKDKEVRFWLASRELLDGPVDIETLLAFSRAVKARDKGDLLVLEYRDVDLDWWEVKAEDDGSLHGYLAVFGNEDLGGDVITPGAFTKTLGEARAFARAHGQPAILPLLWQHDRAEPIGGIVDATEDGHGLRVHCQLDRSIPRGRQAFNGLQAGYLGFSIGYRPVRFQRKGSVRYLNEIALAEGSAVTFPMNREARAA